MPHGGISLEWGMHTIGINVEIPNDTASIDIMSWRRADDKTSEAEFEAGDFATTTAWLSQQIGQ